jgi:hypothetical protein
MNRCCLLRQTLQSTRLAERFFRSDSPKGKLGKNWGAPAWGVSNFVLFGSVRIG